VVQSDDPGSGTSQHVTLKFQNCFFILNQHDAAFDYGLAGRNRRSSLGSTGAGVGWKTNFDNRAAFFAVAGGDISSVLLDDAVADAES